MELSFTAAFIVGLLGTSHCFGMCGGLITAFSGQIPYQGHGSQLQHELTYLCKYNGGRLMSYAIAGMLCGTLSGSLGYMMAMDHYLIWLRIAAGLMMIIMGLYLANWWQGLLLSERLGQVLWSKLHPFTTQLLPKVGKHPFKAGLLWGWLPCGLVYSMLTWAVASGHPVDGAWIMLGFGLGTLPALLSLGMAGQQLKQWLKKRAVRMFSGLLVILMGLQTLYVGINQL